MNIKTEIIIGQEAVCPHGLGRVVKSNYNCGYPSITIKTYINNKECKWPPDKVKLVPITTGELITIETRN